MTEEISDEELERQLRQKWFGGDSAPARPVYSEAEARLARRWFGSDNADRLGRAKDGQRVRIAPVVEKVEWWWVRSTDFMPDEWRVQRIVNGRKEECESGRDPQVLSRILAEHRRRNIPCLRVRLDADKLQEAKQAPARRKSFQERFGNIGGDR